MCKKDWFDIFKVKITVMACIIQTWHAGVLSYARVLCVKIGWFDIFKVKISVMAYIIKIRLFLLYLLNKNVSVISSELMIATECRLVVDCRKSECYMEILDCCI